MTPQFVYLDVDHVLRMHELVIHQTGGGAAVLNRGLLESAVAQPAMTCFGQAAHPDLASKAAAYLFHLCKNHPFEDGNKRTAYVVAEVFLMLNGHALTGSVDELEQFTLGVADGTFTKEQAISFYQSHLIRHPIASESR